MELQNAQTKKKGGRPQKAVKKDQLLAVKCTRSERFIIESKAKSANLNVSEYLREIAMTGKIDRQGKALPREVLNFTATLNHMAANFNQIARKRNGKEELSLIERTSLRIQSVQIKELAIQIKSYLQ